MERTLKVPIAWLLILLSFASAAYSSSGPVVKEDDPTGIWWSPKKDAKIEMSRREGLYYGRIIWVIPDKAEKRDEKNPDPDLRGRKIEGLEIFRDFKFDGKGSWESGFVYDPKSGRTYHAFIRMKGPDLLRATGYIGIKLFSRSVWFERVK
jgi:uncharacterized protein (DUF2147 family)